MADMAPMWPGSPAWPSSQRTHLLPMSAAHVLNNCNDKLATAKLGPNSIGAGPGGRRARFSANEPGQPALPLEAQVRLRELQDAQGCPHWQVQVFRRRPRGRCPGSFHGCTLITVLLAVEICGLSCG